MAIARLHDGLIRGSGDLVWGGDWNQAFEPPDVALETRDTVTTRVGRSELTALRRALSLQLPTSGLSHMSDRMCSIDHIAVPSRWNVRGARVVAKTDAGRLSDHDAYVVRVAV